MKNKSTWIEQYKIVLAENENHFGHNTEFDFLPAFKKIEKLGGQINISYDDEIKIKLPENPEALLIHILTNLPGASNSKFDKKKKELFLEWCY